MGHTADEGGRGAREGGGREEDREREGRRVGERGRERCWWWDTADEGEREKRGGGREGERGGREGGRVRERKRDAGVCVRPCVRAHLCCPLEVISDHDV